MGVILSVAAGAANGITLCGSVYTPLGKVISSWGNVALLSTVAFLAALAGSFATSLYITWRERRFIPRTIA